MTIDLHQLANTPGYGIADRVLTQAGHKKMPKDSDPVWTVEVEYSVAYRVTVVVAAADEKSAKDAARERVYDDPEGGHQEYDGIEIYTVKVL